jgi:hypothetical protein
LQNNRIGKNFLPSAKHDDENKGAPNFYFDKNILNLRHAQAKVLCSKKRKRKKNRNNVDRMRKIDPRRQGSAVQVLRFT